MDANSFIMNHRQESTGEDLAFIKSNQSRQNQKEKAIIVKQKQGRAISKCQERLEMHIQKNPNL